MPIQIKELRIKAVIAEKEKVNNNATIKPEDINRLKKEITKEVTEKVLRILKQKNER